MRRAAALALMAGACFGQVTPLRQRVLILVNERMRESIDVGRYYAERRQIPQANILRLKTNTGETVTPEEYREQIEGPLRRFLDANGGAMRRKILYIVPVYGVPVKAPGKFAVDSMISFMYAGHEDVKPPVRNPYFGEIGSRPPRFAEWNDGVAAANNFKMFVVTRLDGPSAAIARGLVDKAIEGERSVNAKSGVAYFDYQGSRNKSEWQWAVDEEVREGAERARAQGIRTVLNTQLKALCHAMIPPAAQHVWDAARKEMLFDAAGQTGGMSWPVAASTEADLLVQVENLGVQGVGNNATLKMMDADGKSFVRLVYPLVPYQDWNTTAEIVLEKVVAGAVAARAAIKVTNNEKAMNAVRELELSVRNGRIAARRNGEELIAAEDKSGKPVTFARAELGTSCWMFGIRGLSVEDPAGGPVWADDFATDSAARYQWKTPPLGGPEALWVWGWYGPATDSYRFVPGAIGAQLTSFTADRIRTPVNGDPKKAGFAAERWAGNWVPRMLEEGVTATWGAVTEPYATYYARGPNVFDHIWAGYNFGDSFYIAENAARWVMVAVGDPLYAPAAFSKR